MLQSFVFVEPGKSSWYSFNNSHINPDSGVSQQRYIWLYDVLRDSEVKRELSELYPHVVRMLLEKLSAYNATSVPVWFPDGDYRAAPSLNGGYWGPWQD